MRALWLTVCIGISPAALALETISSVSLVKLCQSEAQQDVAVCDGYINGFIDGAFATDPRVAENVVNELEKTETFSERAMRTRLGITLEQFGPSYYAGFCIPLEVPVATIHADLRDAANSNASREVNARDYLYEILQSRYPCK